MPELKAGDSFPEGVSFTYVPYTPEQDDIIACGTGIKYDASQGKLALTKRRLRPLTEKNRGQE
jgi:hypothetical protein